MLNKISINYAPFEEDVHDYDLIKAVSFNVNSQDRLLEILDNL